MKKIQPDAGCKQSATVISQAQRLLIIKSLDQAGIVTHEVYPSRKRSRDYEDGK